jgi:hypothetical protein
MAVMRKIVISLFSGLVLAAGASAATMKGWISDSSCGASNATGKAESRECAERCIKSGAEPVFVSDADQKVYKLAGASKVMDHLKHKVEVSGTVKGDTITVTEIKKAD